MAKNRKREIQSFAPLHIGPAVHVDRYYVQDLGAGVVRISFGQATADAPIQFRCAVVLGKMNAIELGQLLLNALLPENAAPKANEVN